jgi:hypothetical protein
VVVQTHEVYQNGTGRCAAAGAVWSHVHQFAVSAAAVPCWDTVGSPPCSGISVLIRCFGRVLGWFVHVLEVSETSCRFCCCTAVLLGFTSSLGLKIMSCANQAAVLLCSNSGRVTSWHHILNEAQIPTPPPPSSRPLSAPLAPLNASCPACVC